MDTLAVRAITIQANRFLVNWRWHQNNTPIPVGGSFHVSVDQGVEEGAAALAELRAIYYLLQERQVHGGNRLGTGVTIEQSFSAVRKALAKGSLKTSGEGKTQKENIARATDFLATKFFGATISVEQKTRGYSFKSFEESSMELVQDYPRIKVDCPLIEGGVSISRHALFRQVARIDQGFREHEENDLSAIPDTRFEAGWKWFKKVLSSKKLIEETVRPDLAGKHHKYAKSRYLHFPDSVVPAILVLSQDCTGWVISTVLRADKANFIDWPAYQIGQQLVPAHIRNRSRQLQN